MSQQAIITEYLLPEAPEDFKPGRRCENPECRAKVHRYRRRMGADTKGPQGPLLCRTCAKDWLDNEIIQAVEEERRRQERQQSIMLPGLERERRRYREDDWEEGRYGLTQKELGKKAGVNDSFISGVENSSRGVNFTQAHNLARSLGVSVEDLRRQGT